MDPVEIETTITLSRTAAGDIPFGVAVERVAAKSVNIYGKGNHVLSNGTTVCTPTALVTATNPAEGVDGAICLKLATGTVTGLLAYIATTANLNLASDTYWGLLVKSSIDQTVTIGLAEDGTMTTPQNTVTPTLVANEWTYVQVAITGAGTTRDTTNSIGISRAGATPSNIWVQRITTKPGIAYDIAGIAKNDEARDLNIAKQYDELTILAAGHVNPVVVTGFTCQAEEPVYFVPGTGAITKTKITTNVNVRTGMTTEDQTTAGKQTGVRF